MTNQGLAGQVIVAASDVEQCLSDTLEAMDRMVLALKSTRGVDRMGIRGWWSRLENRAAMLAESYAAMLADPRDDP